MNYLEYFEGNTKVKRGNLKIGESDGYIRNFTKTHNQDKQAKHTNKKHLQDTQSKNWRWWRLNKEGNLNYLE